MLDDECREQLQEIARDSGLVGMSTAIRMLVREEFKRRFAA
jgi:hypothetical protein